MPLINFQQYHELIQQHDRHKQLVTEFKHFYRHDKDRANIACIETLLYMYYYCTSSMSPAVLLRAPD